MNDDVMALVGDDETLRAIMALSMNDTHAHTGPPPTSQYGLQEELVDLQITHIHLQHSTQCAICTQPFQLAEDAKKLPCKHFFHDHCIIPWVTQHNTCPLCRYELPTSDPVAEQQRLERLARNNKKSSRSRDMSMYL